MYLLNRNLIRIPKNHKISFYRFCYLHLSWAVTKHLIEKHLTENWVRNPQIYTLDFGMLSYNFDGNCWQRVDGKSLIQKLKKKKTFFPFAFSYKSEGLRFCVSLTLKNIFRFCVSDMNSLLHGVLCKWMLNSKFYGICKFSFIWVILFRLFLCIFVPEIAVDLVALVRRVEPFHHNRSTACRSHCVL